MEHTGKYIVGWFFVLIALAVCMTAAWAILRQRAVDEPCAVLELDPLNGRTLWGVPEDDRTPRRYFFVSCQDGDDARDAPGLPKIGDRGVVDVKLMRDDAMAGVWRAMVSYDR